jgi:hypothetical protein
LQMVDGYFYLNSKVYPGIFCKAET